MFLIIITLNPYSSDRWVYILHFFANGYSRCSFLKSARISSFLLALSFSFSVINSSILVLLLVYGGKYMESFLITKTFC